MTRSGDSVRLLCSEGIVSVAASGVRSGPQAFRIDDDIVRALRNALPAVAADTVAAVMQEVPGYGDGLSGSMGADIESAVRMAIGGFLKLAGGDRNDADP